jgi:hypothetical protein
MLRLSVLLESGWSQLTHQVLWVKAKLSQFFWSVVFWYSTKKQQRPHQVIEIEEEVCFTITLISLTTYSGFCVTASAQLSSKIFKICGIKKITATYI